MRYLKLFENFDEIDRMCQQYNIQNYVINQDGSIDVDGYVNLWRQNLTKLPLKFNKVRDFWCAFNHLITLEGCPRVVTGEFNVANNRLTTLKGGPEMVGNLYWCQNNLLKDVVGFPKYFDHKVYINDNPVYEILYLLNRQYHIKFIFWLNEYDVIRDGSKIVEMRLEEAYWMACKKELPMNKRKFKNYKLI